MAPPRAPNRSARARSSNNKCLAEIPARLPPDAPVAGSLLYVRDGWIRCQWLDIAYVTRELDATR